MSFPKSVQLYHGCQNTYPCFAGFSFITTLQNILFKPLAAFPHEHLKTMVSHEKGMNSDLITRISPQKETAKLGIEPSTFCSQVLCTAN